MAMVGRFNEIPTERMNDEQLTVRDSYLTRAGKLPTPYLMFLSSPKLVTRLESLSTFLVSDATLTFREVELSILVVAQALGSEFYMTAHRNKGAPKAGWSREIIDGLCVGNDVSLLIQDERERAVYDVIRGMVRNESPTVGEFERLTKVLDHASIVELASLLGFYTTCIYTLNFYDVPPPAAP